MRCVSNLKDCIGRMNDQMPTLLTGFGEINFGTQYRQGYRVYDGRKIAMSLCSNPVGGVAGFTYLYLVEVKHEHPSET